MVMSGPGRGGSFGAGLRLRRQESQFLPERGIQNRFLQHLQAHQVSEEPLGARHVRPLGHALLQAAADLERLFQLFLHGFRRTAAALRPKARLLCSAAISSSCGAAGCGSDRTGEGGARRKPTCRRCRPAPRRSARLFRSPGLPCRGSGMPERGLRLKSRPGSGTGGRGSGTRGSGGGPGTAAASSPSTDSNSESPHPIIFGGALGMPGSQAVQGSGYTASGHLLLSPAPPRPSVIFSSQLDLFYFLILLLLLLFLLPLSLLPFRTPASVSPPLLSTSLPPPPDGSFSLLPVLCVKALHHVQKGDGKRKTIIRIVSVFSKSLKITKSQMLSRSSGFLSLISIKNTYTLAGSAGWRRRGRAWAQTTGWRCSCHGHAMSGLSGQLSRQRRGARAELSGWRCVPSVTMKGDFAEEEEVQSFGYKWFVVEKMDNVTGGMETSRQTYDDKLIAVESDLKKLGD
uniref:Uncharacterized protein n=1 Tax=Callithrix jacchus TaxID=9483 RepID=A0A8I4A353_CALJA